MNANIYDLNCFSACPDSGQGKKPLTRRRADRRAPLSAPHEAPFPLPLFSCDRNGRVTGYNEAASALWGRHPDMSQAEQWSGALELQAENNTPLQRSEFPAARAIRAGSNVIGASLTLLRPDGSRRNVLAYASPTLDSDGDAREVICALIDHTERDEMTKAVARAEDEKNAFLSMLSHELRNPLSPILNSAVLLKRMSSDAQVSKIADVVERQAKRLSRFVQDLLEAANLAQGGVALKLERSTLAEVMQSALDSLGAIAATRGQVVFVEAIPSARLVCDAERLSQALANIMENASEFTDNGGRISARASVDGVWARLEVKDNGIGIDPSDIGDIFRPYSHFATHAERARAGAGLGLALAKDICEKHGGSISAYSQGIGQGSCFTISLPIVASHAEPA